MKVKVRCVKKYHDIVLDCIIEPSPEDKNYERIISRERADEIITNTKGAIEIVEVVKEEKIETTKMDVNTEKSVKKTTVKKKASK